MKKLILLLFLIPSLLFAGPLQQKHKSVIARSTGAASCSGTYGETSVLTVGSGPGADVILLFRVALDPCGGTNPTIYGHNKDTHTTYYTRMIVYEDKYVSDGNTGTPGADPGDFLWSGQTDGTDASAWESLVTSMTVSEAAYIWIGLWPDTVQTDLHRELTGGQSRSVSADYTTNAYPDPWPIATDTEDTYRGSYYLSF